MFQEAVTTAGELKRVSLGSRYILLCEWLDMTPVNTKLTAMDEVIVLRRTKRLTSSTAALLFLPLGDELRREIGIENS